MGLNAQAKNKRFGNAEKELIAEAPRNRGSPRKAEAEFPFASDGWQA